VSQLLDRLLPPRVRQRRDPPVRQALRLLAEGATAEGVMAERLLQARRLRPAETGAEAVAGPQGHLGRRPHRVTAVAHRDRRHRQAVMGAGRAPVELLRRLLQAEG
jgi:hypothetical protein